MTVLLFLLLSFPVTTLAWGRAFEPVRLRDGALKMTKASERGEDEDEIKMIRSLDFSQIPSVGYTSRDAFLGRPHGMSPFLWDDHVIEDLHSLEFDMDLTCSGDECDECPIPDDLRMSKEDPSDVLDFLGIRRAEPLRVVRDHDWQ